MRMFGEKHGLSNMVAVIFFLIIFASAVTVLMFAIGKQSQLNRAEVSVYVLLIDKAHERVECSVNGTDALFINKGSKAVQVCYVVIKGEIALNATKVNIFLPPEGSYAVTIPEQAEEVGIITSLGNYFSATR